MEFIETYWIYVACGLVGILIGKAWGKQDALDEYYYAQQQSVEQDTFNQYLNSLRNVEEVDE